MKSTFLVIRMAGIALVAASTFCAAQAVTFSNIDDAILAVPRAPGLFTTTITRDFNNPNKLIIGLDDFRALMPGTLNVNARPNALDTISFRVQAPAGYRIATLTYLTSGLSNIGRVGITSASANWVVDGVAIHLGSRRFGALPGAQPSAWSLSSRFDFTAAQNKRNIAISIANSMVAAITGTLGSASMTTRRAEVTVGLVASTAP